MFYQMSLLFYGRIASIVVSEKPLIHVAVAEGL